LRASFVGKISKCLGLSTAGGLLLIINSASWCKLGLWLPFFLCSLMSISAILRVCADFFDWFAFFAACFAVLLRVDGGRGTG
jgi:hypothetical protein